jgi:oxalate oxidoreductase subunit delta
MSGKDAIREVPFAGTFPSPTAENDVMVTGHWRSLRPVVNQEECTQCLMCWIVCPDACLTPVDNGISINLKYCKGCGICTHVCPVGAIADVPELEFADESPDAPAAAEQDADKDKDKEEA